MNTMTLSSFAIALAVSLPLSAQAGAAAKGAPYDVKGAYYETCACAVSCPCATGKFTPTEPHCDAVALFHFDKARVGKTKLDGLNMALVIRSPKGAKVMEAFEKGEMDLFTFYFDDKAAPEQREAIGQLMPALFGTKEIKGMKPSAWVPMDFSVNGDVAKLNAAGGKLTFEIQNIVVGDETKHAVKSGAKNKNRIELTNTAPFPWVGGITQGSSMSFHYDDHATKWDYKERNAFFGTFSSKGTTPPPAKS